MTLQNELLKRLSRLTLPGLPGTTNLRGTACTHSTGAQSFIVNCRFEDGGRKTPSKRGRRRPVRQDRSRSSNAAESEYPRQGCRWRRSRKRTRRNPHHAVADRCLRATASITAFAGRKPLPAGQHPSARSLPGAATSTRNPNMIAAAWNAVSVPPKRTVGIRQTPGIVIASAIPGCGSNSATHPPNGYGTPTAHVPPRASLGSATVLKVLMAMRLRHGKLESQASRCHPFAVTLRIGLVERHWYPG